MSSQFPFFSTALSICLSSRVVVHLELGVQRGHTVPRCDGPGYLPPLRLVSIGSEGHHSIISMSSSARALCEVAGAEASTVFPFCGAAPFVSALK